jgi:hypothetical protein
MFGIFRDRGYRNRWNFSHLTPHPKSRNYHVQLTDVTVLELVIVPDISHGAARAHRSEVCACFDLETGSFTSNPATFREFI